MEQPNVDYYGTQDTDLFGNLLPVPTPSFSAERHPTDLFPSEPPAPKLTSSTAGLSVVDAGGASGRAPADVARRVRRADELIARLAEIADEIEEMQSADFPASDRIRFTSALGVQATRFGALHDLSVAALDHDQAWEGNGSRTFTDFVRDTSKSSSQQAAKKVRRGKALEEDLPLFKAAFTAGEIDTEKIEVVTRYADDPELKERLGDPIDGEQRLLDLARSRNTDAFRKQVRAWAMKKSPRLAEKKHKEIVREERLSLVADDDGYTIRGWFTSLNGEIVNTALSAIMGVPTRDDPRRPLERRAGALTEMARQILDAGTASKGAKVRPHLSVHVPFELLEKIAPVSNGSALGEGSPVRDRSALGEGSPVGGGSHAPTGSTRVASTSRHGSAEEFECGCPSHGSGSPSGGSGSWHNGLDSPPGGSGSPPGDSGSPPGDSGSRRGGGRQGRCIHEVRQERERAGEILAVIRAGVDEDLLTASPPATLDDGTPIQYSELQTLLCTGELQRILLSEHGEVLDVGRKHRTATPQQARAVIARDRTCRYPGCEKTIGASEIHHSAYWENGGPTDIDNLVMLCWYHHKFVHQESMTITHHRHGWNFSSPRGHGGFTPHAHDSEPRRQ